MTRVVVRVVDIHVMRWCDGAPEYLVMKRSAGQLYEHIWQGVTGKIEDGETAWEAAIRELGEETALVPKRMWTVDHVNFFYDATGDCMNSIPVFGIEVEGDDVRLSGEHAVYQWCPVEEAVALLLWKQQRQGLLVFHDMLTKTTEKLRWMEVNLKGNHDGSSRT